MSDSSSDSDESYFSLDDEFLTKSIGIRPLSSIVILYLKTYLRSERDADQRLKDVELEYKSDGLVINGKDHDVSSAFLWIQGVIRNLSSNEKSIKVPGIAEYLADVKGINFLQRIEKSCSCAHEIKNARQLKLEHRTGDISNFKADVIVKSSSPQDQASCEGSKTSKSLLKGSGNGLKVQPGDVVVKGFNVSCKEVYHVLLSHYNPADGERLLRKSVKTCLEMSEKSGHSSIAFPCLGVAEFSYPAKEVLKVLEQEIKSFDSVHLSKASIVVPPALKATIPQTSSEKGSTTLKVTLGDISKFQADVIVTSSSAQNVSSCAGSVISRALLKQAGGKLQEACKKSSNGNHSIGDVIKTPGFKLYCQEVYHVVLDNFDLSSGEQVLKKAITNCLNMAEKSGYGSMAFPALGAGGFQFPTELVVRCFDRMVKNYKGSSLHDVYLVIFPNDQNAKKAAESVLSINVLQTTLSISKERKVMVFVKQGDITTTTCGAIVNSTKQFDLSGQVGKALVAKAGKSIEDECNKNPVKAKTNMRVTSGGNLCKYILHLNTPTDTNELKKLLCECFCEADALGVDSLAMPPVGTGGIGLSSSVVAKCMASAIDKFNKSKPKNVKKIEVFVFQQNMVPDFQGLAQQTQNVSKFASKDLNSLSVTVRPGDITSSTCEALVNSTSQFNLSSQVSKALLAKAGQTIAQECSNNPISSTNNMRVTSGGNLCKYILHLATPSDSIKLEQVLFECFVEADKLGVQSLAVPPVGTGAIGLSSGTVAKCLASAINKFDQRKPNNLKQISVYVYQIAMLNDFQREVANIPTKALRPSKQFTKSGFQPTLASTVCVGFCSRSKENIDKAFAKLNKKVEELSFTQIIKDEAIKNFTPDEEQELQNLMSSKNVLIKQVSNTELKIQGSKTNQSSVIAKVNQIMNELKQALPISDYVEWWYAHPNDNKMKKFPVRASFELENTYKKNNYGQINVTVHDTIPNLYLAVDFSKMEANTGVSTCKVERRLISQRPTFWCDMGDETLMKVPVAAKSLEFQNILQKFRKTLKLNEVTLERIQNITQWNQFQEQKKKIEKKIPNQLVTRELFHGTDAATSEIIWKDTFDRSHAGRNATYFGKGVYFATTARYSQQYTSKDSQGHSCMFLAEVITGTYCVGNKDTHTIPMQADGTPFDSVVDNLQSPNMFVVFRDTSVYPSYLLTYKT